MTYRNTQRLWLGWALLSSLTLWSGPGTAAPAETAAPGKPAQAMPAAAPASATESCSLSPAEDRGAARAGTGGVDLAGFPPEPRREHLHQHHAGGLDLQAHRRSRRMALPAGRHDPEGGRQRSARGPASATPRAGGRPLRRLLAASTLFDAELTGAVKRFQARHGLPESGAVRARTLEALNVPALTRHRQLTASAQRLAGSTFAFGDRYVVVNIPSAAVEADRARRSRPPLCRDRRQGGPALADRRDARHGRQPQPDMDGARLAHQEGHHPPCPQGSRLSRTR